jgi:uncharacterized RDD family membrane protein YckC
MPGPVVYAGLVTRAVAIVIDALLIDAAALAVTGAVLFFVWVVSYFVTFWTTTGQTPGSRVMQIRLARVDGGHVGIVRALVRLAGMVVSLPFLWGYLPILWTARRRTAFDLVAGTAVTVVPPLLPTAHRGEVARVAGGHSRGIEPPSTVP